MNTPETLKPNETPAAHTETSLPIDGTINQSSIEQLYNTRKQELEKLKSHIGLKLYYRITEKLDLERTRLLKLLRLEDTKQEHLSKYSFILDSQFFEQKFLS